MDHLKTTAERDAFICSVRERPSSVASARVLALKACPRKRAHRCARHVADCQPALSKLSLHHVAAGRREMLPIQADYSEIKTPRQELSEGHSVFRSQLYYSRTRSICVTVPETRFFRSARLLPTGTNR